MSGAHSDVAGRMGRLRLLLVEDNPGDAELIREHLAEAPGGTPSLRVTETLTRAVEALGEEEFDAVLLDLNLPDSSGLETVDALTGQAPEMPVVVLTGLGDRDTGLEAIERGADDFLPKGEITGSHLIRSVWHAVERRRQEQARERAESRARRYLDISGAVIVALDRDGRITMINRTGAEILGFDDPDELEGRSWFDLAIPAEDRSRIEGVHEAVMDGADTVSRFENEVVTRSGERRVVSWQNAVLRDDDGRIVGTLSSGIDITERVESERDLRLLGEALDAAANALMMTDPDGVVEWVNPAFTELTGYSEEEALGRTPGELLRSGEHGDAVYRELWETILDGEVWEGRLVNRRKDGTLYLEQQTITPVLSESGEVEHFISVKRNVTEDVRAERERRRLLSIVDATPEFIGIADAEGKVEYINDAGREMVGLDPEAELDDVRIDDLSPDWAVERIRNEGIPTAVEAGSWTGETAFFGPSGEEIPVWQVILAHLDDDGRVRYLSTVARDLTDRKRAEEALREREARLRTLLENTGDTVTILEPDGTIRYSSSTRKEILGGSGPGHVGQNALDVDAIHPDDVEVVAELLEEARAAPGETVTRQVRLRHEDGSWRTLETQARDLTHLETIRGIVVNSRDVTERLELQRQLRQAQKMEAVGRLAGGVAHDFNNLLTVIRANADFVLLDQPGHGPWTDEVQSIRDAADQAADLTNELLAFSRDQVLRPRVIDPNEVIHDLQTLVSRALGEHVRLELEVDEAAPAIRVDPGQFEQALLNLAMNARDAMPDGGTLTFSTCRVEVDADEAELRPDLEPGSYVRIAVSDTGVGMEEAVRAKIFEPFFSTKEEGRGTGLGLAMVYGIVSQSGGAIDVESEPGEGTTFEIHIPAAEGEPEPVVDAEASILETVDLSGRILVVEDDPSVRRVTRLILERTGFDVTAVERAERGLELLENGGEDFDVILSDLVLPGMNGREFLETVAGRFSELPLVAMSGYAEGSPGRRGDLPREIRFIQKPFAPDGLIEVIQKALAEGSG